MTVLETFRARGAFTLASTHLMAMKVYGASTAGVRNGWMGFDDDTFQPTYVLRLGAPGKSAGLDIASRLGLDPARARVNVYHALVGEATIEQAAVATSVPGMRLVPSHIDLAGAEIELATMSARESWRS